MRTTIRIDEELLSTLREQAHQEGVPLTVVANRALRRGLSAPESRSRPQRVQQETHKMGRPLVPLGHKLDQALALAGILEDEEILRKMRMHK